MKPPGSRASKACGNETAVDAQAILVGEQGESRLVVPNFNGKGSAIRGRDVGRIGNDNVESLASGRHK